VVGAQRVDVDVEDTHKYGPPVLVGLDLRVDEEPPPLRCHRPARPYENEHYTFWPILSTLAYSRLG